MKAPSSDTGSATLKTETLLKNRTTDADLGADSSLIYQLAVEAADIGVWFWDLRTGKITWNDIHRRILGVDDTFVPSYEAFLSHVHEQDKASVQENVRRALEEKSAYHCTYRLVRPDGKLIWVEGAGRAFYDESGKPTCMMGTTKDVTSTVSASKELIRAKEDAETASKAKSAFLANITHDLKTPLTTILGFADILMEDLEGENRECVEVMKTSANRLLGTLDSALTLARMEGQQMQMHLNPLNLAEEMKDLCRMYAPQFEKKGLAFRCEFHVATGTPLYALADREAFRRVMENLVSNALKFTNEGEVEVDISVDDNLFTIAVSDTGMGVSDDFLPLIFERFKRENSSRVRTQAGSGLGLAVAKELAERMGGRLTVESRDGRGSTFFLKLPMMSGSAGEAGTDPSASSAIIWAPLTRTPRKVLVVDDEADTRKLWRSMLGARHECLTAADTEEALRHCEADSDIDVAILNILPGGHEQGEDLAKTLRDHSGQSLYLVVCTASLLPEEKEALRGLGFDAYLSKPFDKESVEKVLTNASGDGGGPG